jgi:ribosomal protein L11 methyltransferase
MYLWQRLAPPQWWAENEERLRSRLGHRLAVIERPKRTRLQVEAACESRAVLRDVAKEFGGRIEKLPTNWLRRFSQEGEPKPLKVGKRLIINVGGTSASRQHRPLAHNLLVPAGAAFGTGEHPTTAMSLRLLEQTTRGWKAGWSIADLGTGSGILALAGKRFGARRITAIDDDPIAISTAKRNARLNRIDNVQFRVADVRGWKLPRHTDIVTANLFSELLIEILPALTRGRWLILSGILREQEDQLTRALRRQKIDLIRVCRRGKWIALLARCSGGL